jgi:hypothetical protein
MFSLSTREKFRVSAALVIPSGVEEARGKTLRQLNGILRLRFASLMMACQRQRPGIISRRKPLKYSVSGMVGRTG